MAILKIFSYKCSWNDLLPKFLKWFYSAEQSLKQGKPLIAFSHSTDAITFMANLSSGELSRAILALLFRPDYIHYIFFVGFPMYLHCIYLLRFFKRFANFYFSTHRSHLKLLHLFGSFPCLFPLYTFVTLLERCI